MYCSSQNSNATASVTGDLHISQCRLYPAAKGTSPCRNAPSPNAIVSAQIRGSDSSGVRGFAEILVFNGRGGSFVIEVESRQRYRLPCTGKVGSRSHRPTQVPFRQRRILHTYCVFQLPQQPPEVQNRIQRRFTTLPCSTLVRAEKSV